MTKASLLFCLGRWPYVLTTPHLARTVTFVFTYTSLMPLVGLMWRFLLGFSGAFLLDCGAYEAPTLAFGAPHPPLVTWAALQAAAGLPTRGPTPPPARGSASFEMRGGLSVRWRRCLGSSSLKSAIVAPSFLSPSSTKPPFGAYTLSVVFLSLALPRGVAPWRGATSPGLCRWPTGSPLVVKCASPPLRA